MPNTVSIKFDQIGSRLLRYFAAKYPERAIVDFLERDNIIRETGVSDSDYDRWIAMFATCRLITIQPVESGRYAEMICVESNAVLAVNQLDNQPPPDYWKKAEVWFRSKWWSVPVVLIGVGAGWCLGVIGGLKVILQWFGAVK